MSRYIETSTRKMIGAYAGVGALVEDTKGSILIDSLEEWPFIKNIRNNEDYYINDKRLLDRLKNDKGFPEIKYLVRMPPNSSRQFTSGIFTQPQNLDDISTGQYFPRWMYCEKCNRFNSLFNWFNKWDKVIEQYEPLKSKNVRDMFIPPKCGFCYEAKLINSKKNSKKYLNPDHYQLTQVRFIMTSSNGEIVDFPWDKWITLKNEKYNALLTGDLTFDDIHNLSPCCNNQDLSYVQEAQGDFSSIKIKCKNPKCNKSASLEGIFGFKYSNDKSKEFKYKVVIRSSNSVYYPILIHSIYLPNDTTISDVDQLQINEWLKDSDYDINTIYLSLSKRYSKDQIKAYQHSLSATSNEKEVDYRRKEYQFILNHTQYEKDDFIFTHQEIKQISKNNIITNLTKVSRLKMTSIQTGYSRQEPIDVDLFLSGELDEIKPKYTTNKGKNTDFLLGIENYGEGIFISLDNEPVNNYINSYSTTLNKTFSKAQASPLFENKFSSKEHLGRYIFVHTLSHLLMKELEFTCGYPTVSLSERLFVDSDDMQGVLIFTVAGMDGSYGGLASQANPERFNEILIRAIERSEDCASDPICYHSTGQGVGDMNQAACYSCALVAENACESFNSFLDRKIREFI
jgi:hypothetical protein